MILTPDQRLRVFVSSTLGELASERAVVKSAIESLRLAPVMFEMGARPHPPRALYRAYLEQSHVFLAIYANRYGWVAPSMDLSGLEDEYRLSGDRPKLVYVLDPAPDRDAQLTAMLADVADDPRVRLRLYGDADELGRLVADDLAALLAESFGSAPTTQATGTPSGPLRTSPGDTAGITSLPVPTSSLIGREDDLAAVREGLGDRIDRRPLRVEADAEPARDARDDQAGLGHLRERDEHDAAGEVALEPVGDLEGQARLPDPAHAGDGHEPYAVAAAQLLDRGEVVLAPDERAGGHGQRRDARGVARGRAQRPAQRRGVPVARAR